MPSRASRKRDCWHESAKVKDFRPPKMMGSAAHVSVRLCASLPPLCLGNSHTVGNDDAVFALDCFVCDCFREVDSKEDGVHLPPYWIEGRFQEHFCFSPPIR